MKPLNTPSPLQTSLFPTLQTRALRCFKPIAAAVAVLAGPSFHAAGATSTWTGSVDGSDWSDSTKWSGTNKPPLAADTALFNIAVGTNGTIGVASATSITSISFDTFAGSINNTLTIGAVDTGVLTLQSGGTVQILSTLRDSGKTLAINAPIKLGGNYTFANNNLTVSNVLDIGGPISRNSATNMTLTLSGSNTGANTISGEISNGTGAGALSVAKSGVGTWVLTGANSYTGGTTINGGALVLAGASGGIASSNTVTVSAGGTLSFDSSTGVNAGSRAKYVSLKAGNLTAIGNASANSVETINGNLTIDVGFSTVTLNPNSAKSEQLTAGGLLRNAFGAVVFRGTNLGVNTIASATANSSNISFTTAPTLTGAGGSANTSTVGIIPWALIDTTATGMGSSLATYDPTYGLRALNSNEYVTSLTSGDASNSNLNLTSDQTFSANTNTLVNSVMLNGGNALGSGTLTVGSGAIFAGSTGTIDAPVVIGAEGYFNAAAGATLNVNNLNLVGNNALNLNTTGAGTVNVTITSSGTLAHLASIPNYLVDANLTLADGVAVQVGSDNLNTSYFGTLNGSGTFIKIGTGTLIIEPAQSTAYLGNHYSGNIEIAQGTFLAQFGASGMGMYGAWLTTGTMTIDSGATVASGGQIGVGALVGSGTLRVDSRNFGINYNGSAVDTFAGSFGKSGAAQAFFLKYGTGTLDLTGDNSLNLNMFTNMWGTLRTAGVTGTTSTVVYGGLVKVTGTSGSVTGLGNSTTGLHNDTALFGGTLWIAPDTVSGGAADIKVTGLATTGVAGGQAVNFKGDGGRLLLDKGGNNSLTYTIGSAVTSSTTGAVIIGNGLIIAAAHGLSALGDTEKFCTLKSIAVPTLTHGVVNTKIIGQDARVGSTLNGDFLTYKGTGVDGDGGFTPFDYASSDGDTDFFKTTSNATVEKVTKGVALSNNTAVFALRNDGQTIAIDSGKTLTIGDISQATSAGLIMNGGAITGGTLAFVSSASNQGVSIYTSALNATIDSAIVSNGMQLFIQGPGVLTYSGHNAFGTAVVVNYGATLESDATSISACIALNGGVYQSNGSYTRGLGSGAGQVTFQKSNSSGAGGGFAARGGALNVNLGGLETPSQVVWNNGDSANGTANFRLFFIFAGIPDVI